MCFEINDDSIIRNYSRLNEWGMETNKTIMYLEILTSTQALMTQVRWLNIYFGFAGTSYWWLVTLVVAFGFLPQNFGRYVGSVVGIPCSGGDTQTLPHAKKFGLTFSGDAKTLGVSACAWAWGLMPSLRPDHEYLRPSHLVEISLPNFWLIWWFKRAVMFISSSVLSETSSALVKCDIMCKA